MRPSGAHRASLRAIVARYKAYNPRIFGSVLHGNDTPDQAPAATSPPVTRVGARSGADEGGAPSAMNANLG